MGPDMLSLDLTEKEEGGIEDSKKGRWERIEGFNEGKAEGRNRKNGLKTVIGAWSALKEYNNITRVLDDNKSKVKGLWMVSWRKVDDWKDVNECIGAGTMNLFEGIGWPRKQLIFGEDMEDGVARAMERNLRGVRGDKKRYCIREEQRLSWELWVQDENEEQDYKRNKILGCFECTLQT